MNNRSIEVIGTFQGCWTEWVSELLSEYTAVQIHADTVTWTGLETFLRRHLGSDMLILVEHPTIKLAQMFATGEALDPEAWLHEWLLAARTLLAHAQSNPETTVVVNAAEVQSKPQRFAQFVRTRWGEDFDASTRIVAPRYRPDPLVEALAWSVYERDLDLQEVVPELLGMCVVLPGSRPSPLRPLEERPTDSSEVARRLSGLLQVERQYTLLERERTVEAETLRSQLATYSSDCKRLAAAIEELRFERDDLVARVSEGHRLLAETRLNLETIAQERSALLLRLDDSVGRNDSSARALMSAQEHLLSLNQELERTRSALTQAEEARRSSEQAMLIAKRRHSSLEQEIGQVTKQREALEQELQLAKDSAKTINLEVSHLRAHLHESQDELERLVRANRDLENDLFTTKADLDHTTKNRDALAQELSLTVDQRDNLERQLAVAIERVENLQADLERISEDLGHSVEAKLKAEDELRRTTGELDQAQRQNALVERSLAEAKARVASLEFKLSQVEERRDSLEQDLTGAIAACRTADEERDLTKQQLSKVQRELEDTVRAKREAEGALHAAKEHLALATKQRVSLEQELAQAGKERQAFEDGLSQATKQLRSLEQELHEAKKVASVSAEEGALLKRQLHQVQGALERSLVDKRKPEDVLPAEAKASDPQELEHELRGAREECELLTLQIHQLEQELERIHGEGRRLERELKARVEISGFSGVSIGEVVVLGERDTPPHREVSFLVRDVQVGERHLAEARVRLVEHWGRPGLVIFSNGTGAQLLEPWHESGHEDGVPYLLLVHGDEGGQSVYDSLGSLDWQLIHTLAARMRQVLLDPSSGISTRWSSLAQRLLLSLHELPARLRYESVAVGPVEIDSTGHPRFQLALENASFGGRTWERLPITWQPGGRARALALEVDEESGPPLLAWPAEADGSPKPRLLLRICNDPGAPDVVAAWDSLLGCDRALLGQLLELLPALVEHLQAAKVAAGDSATDFDLQAAATTTMEFGRAALRQLQSTVKQSERRPPLLERMARRLGVGTSADPRATSAPEPALDN